MRTIPRLVLVVASIAGSMDGCRRAGPDIDVAVSPRYPCAGDSIVVAFSSAAADRIEVKDANGREVGRAAGASGTITVPHVDGRMLPLTATGWQENRSRALRVPGDVPLTVIDGTTKTEPFVLDHELAGREARKRIGTENCGCTLDDDGAPLLCEPAAPVYEVRTSYDGADGLLERAWFSPRAHVVGVTNGTPFGLTYLHGDNRIAAVGAGGTQSIDYASEIAPAGTWAGRLSGRAVGEPSSGIYVEGGNVCSGWIHRAAREPGPKLTVGFLLRCME
jgi:hypothetical protein